MMQQFCATAGCSVEAFKRPDALALDAATLDKLDHDTYRLAFVIKNLSELSLALPSVELSVTDAQEHVIIRRVLTRAELFDSAVELPAATEHSVSRVVQIRPNDAGQQIVGYRLLAFYP